MQTLLGVSFGTVLCIYTLICGVIGVVFSDRVDDNGFIRGIFGVNFREHSLASHIIRILIILIFLPSIIFFMIFMLVQQLIKFIVYCW